MEDKPRGFRAYTPSQAAPRDDQALRHYLNRELRNIQSAFNSLHSRLPPEGFGGVKQAVTEGIGNIEEGDNWQILPSDTVMVAAPENVLQDTVANGLAFLAPGVWSVSLTFSLAFASKNSGRYFWTRLYDITDSNPLAGKEAYVAVGRDAEGITFSITLMGEITPEMLNHVVGLQIGDADDAFTTVSVQAFTLGATLIKGT